MQSIGACVRARGALRRTHCLKTLHVIIAVEHGKLPCRGVPPRMKARGARRAWWDIGGLRPPSPPQTLFSASKNTILMASVEKIFGLDWAPFGGIVFYRLMMKATIPPPEPEKTLQSSRRLAARTLGSACLAAALLPAMLPGCCWLLCVMTQGSAKLTKEIPTMHE